MRTTWKKVRLREVLTAVERPEPPMPGRIYRQLGVKLWGEGAYERESMDGAATKYATLSRVEEDDIVVNKIWARNGSVAVVQTALAGCYVSGEFPTFATIPDSLLPRWMHWLTKTPGFWAQCDEKSQGTSGKNRIKPEQFLNVEIPLPPLSEQRRIVARIEELAGKITEARDLRQRAVEEAEALSASWRNSTFSRLMGDITRPLGEIAKIIGGGSLPELLEPHAAPPMVLFVKVSDMNRPGNEVFLRHSAAGVTQDSPALKGLRVLPPRAIVFPKRGGAIATNKKRILQSPAVLDPNMMGVYSTDEQRLAPDYLFAWFKSLDLAAMQDGTSVPQINKGNFSPLQVPLPPLSEQHRIVAYLDGLQAKVDALKKLQAETAAELDALLPSILDRAFKGEL